MSHFYTKTSHSLVRMLSEEAEKGFFQGYASTFHTIDIHRDSILPGAFTQSIREHETKNHIKLLWQHKASEPIGRITKLYEDSVGLVMEGTLLLNIQRARDVYEMIKSKVVNSLSIGFNILKDRVDGPSDIRYIHTASLMEISIVTFPANPEALISSVKSHYSNEDKERIEAHLTQLLEVLR